MGFLDCLRDHEDPEKMLSHLIEAQTALEILAGWRRLAANMPWFSLPPEYEFKMMPPFGLASIRFGVRLRNNPDQECSISFDALGLMNAADQPYWEVYPLDAHPGKWPQRFAMDDTEGLVQGIIDAIADSNKEPLQAVEFKLGDDDE